MEYFPIKESEHYKRHSLFTSIIMLTTLYFIQSIPVGFFLNLPLIWLTQDGVNAKASEQLSLFTFISYPFSFKILLAPLQDMFYFCKFGRRKTYIVPCQYILSIISLLFACQMENCVQTFSPNLITIVGLVMSILNAVQDIGIDGWALTLLAPEQLKWGSVCQNIGQLIGTTVGGPLFVTLNSVSFCNKFLFKEEQVTPFITIHGLFTVYGIFTFIVTILIHLFAREQIGLYNSSKDSSSFKLVISTFKGFYKNKNIKFLMFILITWRLGFALVLAPAPLILVEKQFPKELLTNISVMMIPFDMIISILVGKFVKQGEEFKVFKMQFWLRAADVVYIYFIVKNFEINSQSLYIPLIVANYLVWSIYRTTCFVNFGAFFNRISDESIGGTYITALQSCHNLGQQLSNSLAMFLFAYLDFKVLAILGLAYEIFFILGFNGQLNKLQIKSKDEWKLQIQQISFIV